MIKDQCKGMDNTRMPNAPQVIGDNEAIPKVSTAKPPNPKPRVQEDNLRRSTRVRIPNKKYIDISSIPISFSSWNPNPSYRIDIHIV